MKTSFKNKLCLILALVFALVCAAPAFASMTSAADISDYDKEKLLAFWQQEAYDGLNNGEAVYDFPEGCYFFDTRPEYDGSYYTHLLELRGPGENVPFILYLQFSVPGTDGTVGGEKESSLITMHPDLYGPLDLSGTNVNEILTQEGDLTHITNVNLNDCPHLGYFIFRDQPAASKFSAVNSSHLSAINTVGSTFTSMDFDLYDISKTMHVRAFGNGSIAVRHDPRYYGDEIRLYAVPENEGSFLGWYLNNECVSEELEMVVDDGGNYTAVFGGDANGDGAITVTDAILALRASMGVVELANADMADVNGSGSVDVGDAIIILRFAMGII